MKYKHIVNLGRVVLPWRKNIFTKRYLSAEDQEKLLSAEDLVITEKIDGLTTPIEVGDLTFFCENLKHKHSIVYDRVPRPRNGAEPWLVCFDVSDGGVFLPHDEMVEWADVAGYETPTIIHRGPIMVEKLWEIAHFKSHLATNSDAEGVVLKSHSLGIWGKLVVDEFLSEIGEHWRTKELVINQMI